MFVRKLPAPHPVYSTLSDVLIQMDARGLRDNTDNIYGTVTSGVVSVWKSLVGTFSFNALAVGTPGEASVLKFQDGYIEFPGYVVLNSNQAASAWNGLSFASPATNLKWTVHMVLKVGQNPHPNAFYGFFGNNAASGGNKGTITGLDDRVTLRSDAIFSTLTHGAGATITSLPENVLVPNVPFVYTEETDLSQAAGDRRKHYINGTQIVFSVTSPGTTLTTSPSFTVQIGSGGNLFAPFRGWISHMVIQTRIESESVRNAFIASLLPFKNKTSNFFYNVDESRTYSVHNTLATAGRYYFVQGLIKSPTDNNKVIQIYHDGNQHTWAADKKVAARISSDRCRTFGTQFDVYDESGDSAVQDGEWGWGSDGRIHGITDWHTSLSPGGTHKLLYHYSDNELTNVTTVDITSIVPSDSLVGFRAHGNIIENNGFLYACLYKFTDEGSFTNSANYILRKPVGASTTWTVFTVRASASAYINEMSLAALDDNTILCLARSDATFEWNQFIGTSNGSSWADQGAITFGESLTVAGPPLLTSFNMTTVNGTARVIAAWILNKEAATKALKVVYGTAANIIANGLTGWDTDTKFTVTTGSTQFIHYGRVCHLDNNFNAIGSFAFEPNPFTGNDNNLITFTCPATNYFNTKTQLGL